MKFLKSLFGRLALVVLVSTLAVVLVNVSAKDTRPKGMVTGAEVTGRTVDSTLVEFNLSGHIFRVPRNYLWIKTQWQGRSTEGPPARRIYMEATVEGLEPYSDKTKAAFRNEGKPLRVIGFDVGATKFDRFYGAAFLAEKDYSRCDEADNGYKICSYGQTKFEILSFNEAFVSQELIVNNIYLDCRKKKPNSVALYSSCRALFRYKPHVMAGITFKRSHLPQVLALFFSVKKRLDSFYVGFQPK